MLLCGGPSSREKLGLAADFLKLVGFAEQSGLALSPVPPSRQEEREP